MYYLLCDQLELYTGVYWRFWLDAFSEEGQCRRLRKHRPLFNWEPQNEMLLPYTVGYNHASDLFIKRTVSAEVPCLCVVPIHLLHNSIGNYRDPVLLQQVFFRPTLPLDYLYEKFRLALASRNGNNSDVILMPPNLLQYKKRACREDCQQNKEGYCDLNNSWDNNLRLYNYSGIDLFRRLYAGCSVHSETSIE